MGSILAFFAHPDDEAYSISGTLALAVDRGLDVHLVCATNGKRGMTRSGVSPADLGSIRQDELRAAAAAIGCGEPAFLQLPDGELSNHIPQGERMLSDLLMASNATSVITHGLDGAYGHVDHLACAQIAAQAIAKQHSANLWHVAFPPQLFSKVAQRLRRVAPNLVAPTDQFGMTPESVTLRCDVRATKARKLDALRAHTTQLTGGDPYSLFPDGIIAATLEEEWLVSAQPFDGDTSDPIACL